ncbi:MAG: carboxypeptidase-like regulatory domain-containing protein [Pyrinomonadaceae bacterium]
MTGKKLYFVLIALSVSAVVWSAGFSSNPIFGSLEAKANGYYLEIAAGSPLREDWTDTSRINADDDWTQIAGIEAFSGDTLAPVPGTDPRTILADNPNNPLDVKANQTNPATSAAEGVSEFEIANPVIALKGSDTFSAPNLVVHLNTTMGCLGKGVVVIFNIRDIDNSANNAVTPITAQYRIGGVGNYTNIASSYIADATTGPNQGTLVTPMRITLPLAATGQAKLDVRIITTNSVGADELVGIDDLFIDCIHPTTGTSNVGGRVVDSFGRGISKVTVTIQSSDAGGIRTAQTNPFGYYRFDALEVGNFYVVTVNHKRYVFGKNSQGFQLVEDMDSVNFTATQ